MTQFNTDEMDAGIAEIFSMKTPVGRQAKIASILQEISGKTEVKLTDRLVEDLGLDSLDFFQLSLFLEVVTGHIFDSGELSSVKTVGDVFALVESKYVAPC